MNRNQAPEQRARDRIDDQLRASGWAVQGMEELNPAAARGVAVRECPTDTRPMDYLLMVDGEPVGLVEAKREEEGHRISWVEEQSARYANAELRHIGRADLRFVYEATGEITRFTDRLTREKRWSPLHDELEYAGTQFDPDTMNPSRTRIFIRALPDAMPRMSADRQLSASEVNLPPGTSYV